MKNIADIDKNLKIETEIPEKDIVFYDIKNAPFAIYGIYYDVTEKRYMRMPREVAASVNDGVNFLCSNTAGGRVRFKTDSPYVAISVRVPNATKFSHMTVCGTSGFDMYLKENGSYIYNKTFIPPFNIEGGYEGIQYFSDDGLKDITLNFPLYNDVSEVYIGIKEGFSVLPGDEYTDKRRVVYYGSSITQGGCASRPGNAYQAMLSREFDSDFLNLGFSGSARGEKEIADYIANLRMDVFVYDYDHNAPSEEHLKKTHLPMLEIIRKKNPDIPVVLMTMPFSSDEAAMNRRKKIILDTYNTLVSRGDKNIYYIDCDAAARALAGDAGSVDNCHPNDIGFLAMANACSEVFKKFM